MTMNRTQVVAATLSLVFTLAGIAQNTTQTARETVQKPIGSPHTVDQYRQLADYFHQQEAKYRAKAAAEKSERDQRAQINAGLMQKYPRPVDSAQYLYETYLHNADRAAAQALHYDQLAQTSPQR
jgi:cytochrome c biogenesis factor